MIVSKLVIENLSFAGCGPVNLQINAGEIICLSGESGAGKSLFLRAIADIIPALGNRLLDQTDCLSLRAPLWRRMVGLLPAETQWWHDSIGEHFAKPESEHLSELGLDQNCMNWQVSRCSTGEKQRLALLRLLQNEPQCLLLDEPTGSLDSQNTLRVERLIRSMAQNKQLAVLWVSHSMEQIQRIADRHYVMQSGKLLAYE